MAGRTRAATRTRWQDRFPPKVLAGCLGKVRHRSQGKAEAAVRSLVRLGLDAGGGELRAYFCVRCRSWHVGHRRA